MRLGRLRRIRREYRLSPEPFDTARYGRKVSRSFRAGERATDVLDYNTGLDTR